MTSHFLSVPRVAALSVTITVLASSIAAAQTPASTPAAGETVLPAHGLVASPADVKRAVGTEVRVTFSDRSTRKGTLVSLSASGVTLRTRDGDAVLPLAQVWKVDKTSHNVRKGALIGLLVGAGVGVWPAMQGNCGDGCGWWPYYLGTFSGAGAGVGALIGSGIHLERDAIYDAGRSPQPVVRLTPIVTPRRAGAHLSVNW